MDINWVIMIVLSILGGIHKAMRDTISFHWERSIFNKIKNEKWRQWFKSDGRKHDHLIWFLWDGWHFGDTISYVALLIAMIFVTSWLQVLFCAALFAGFFQLFYHRLFVVNK